MSDIPVYEKGSKYLGAQASGINSAKTLQSVSHKQAQELFKKALTLSTTAKQNYIPDLKIAGLYVEDVPENYVNATVKQPNKNYFQNYMQTFLYGNEVQKVACEKIVTNPADSANLEPPFEIKIQKHASKNTEIKTISIEFHQKLLKLAEEIPCDYGDLIAIMNFESGMNPTVGSKNPKNRPVGLIQFTRFSLIALNKKFGLNLTKEAVSKMSSEEQIDLVTKYLKMTKESAPRLRNKRKLDAADLYSLVLLPNRAGRDILCRKDETDNTYYKDNAAIDVGQDGIISRADVIAKLDEFRVDIKVV